MRLPWRFGYKEVIIGAIFIICVFFLVTLFTGGAVATGCTAGSYQCGLTSDNKSAIQVCNTKGKWINEQICDEGMVCKNGDPPYCDTNSNTQQAGCHALLDSRGKPTGAVINNGETLNPYCSYDYRLTTYRCVQNRVKSSSKGCDDKKDKQGNILDGYCDQGLKACSTRVPSPPIVCERNDYVRAILIIQKIYMPMTNRYKAFTNSDESWASILAIYGDYCSGNILLKFSCDKDEMGYKVTATDCGARKCTAGTLSRSGAPVKDIATWVGEDRSRATGAYCL